ncbi:MAG: S8 family serine peptidase, partial [Chloroflexi bacterium]|nr:S8 family serine peptidase [Chloroflexota bacterium]
ARALLAQNGVSYRAHYLINMLEVTGDAAVAQQLAALPEVTQLEVNAPAAANLPRPTNQLSNEPTSIASVEWGVMRVHAPDVWSAYGKRGEGVVVGTADTGVQWEHPALKPHYRGWDGTAANHDYNWHDAIHDAPPATCNNNSTQPCDDYGHGTHVTGTMVGDDGAGNQIGIAPGAKWIGCRNMDSTGNGTPARYIECFEFMLAPYPVGGDPLTQGRPDLGADIINNSWTCAASEGCTTGNELQGEVQKLNAAGILVVAAAGNPGSACEGVAEAPARYAETFTVGATDSGDNIAGFSARGPVKADGSNRLKPNVSAPGVSVRSSFPGNNYGSASGTSMASP